jgi:hypothetical protein
LRRIRKEKEKSHTNKAEWDKNEEEGESIVVFENIDCKKEA